MPPSRQRRRHSPERYGTISRPISPNTHTSAALWPGRIPGIRKPALDAENALRYGIPDAIRPTSLDHLPVHKYLGECGRVAEDGSVDYAGLPPIIQSLAEKSLEIGRCSRGRFERELEGHLTTPRQVMNSDYSMYFKLDCLVLLPEQGYEIEELREVLVELFDEEQTNNNRAGLRRVLCKFDRQLTATQVS